MWIDSFFVQFVEDVVLGSFVSIVCGEESEII